MMTSKYFYLSKNNTKTIIIELGKNIYKLSK